MPYQHDASKSGLRRSWRSRSVIEPEKRGSLYIKWILCTSTKTQVSFSVPLFVCTVTTAQGWHLQCGSLKYRKTFRDILRRAQVQLMTFHEAASVSGSWYCAHWLAFTHLIHTIIRATILSQIAVEKACHYSKTSQAPTMLNPLKGK